MNAVLICCSNRANCASNCAVSVLQGVCLSLYVKRLRSLVIQVSGGSYLPHSSPARPAILFPYEPLSPPGLVYGLAWQFYVGKYF